MVGRAQRLLEANKMEREEDEAEATSACSPPIAEPTADDDERARLLALVDKSARKRFAERRASQLAEVALRVRETRAIADAQARERDLQIEIVLEM